MQPISNLYDYLRTHANELGERILSTYPALHQVDDPPSPRLGGLLRQPFPAQTLAIMGIVKRWNQARTAKVIAECGTGKTLISLGAMYVRSGGRAFTALAMVPPHIVEKWAREALNTIPGIRVFLIDDLRNGGAANSPHGINEVRLRRGSIVRNGLRTTLTDLRLSKGYPSARQRWEALCARPALFIVGRDRAKLGYFWRHAYQMPRSGRYRGCVVNPASGAPVMTDEGRLTIRDFDKVRIAEVLTQLGEKPCQGRYAPLWQADNKKIPRVAPVDFISRYMDGFFDYAVCDELHQARCPALCPRPIGALASCAERSLGLTGTLLGIQARAAGGRAVDVLVARKEVDSKRIGYVGHSLGATWGGPLAAVEKRIKMFVLMGGLPSLTNYDDDSCYAEVQRASTPRNEFQKYAAVIEPYNPEHFVANTGPAKIYFQWATHDMFISKHSADEYYEAVGGRKEQHWYFTSHEFNDGQSCHDRREWLARELELH